ncbi:MAG: LysE family translocator [Pseudomonadota bacterium]
MTWDAWIIFALFWVVFVTTPGPNAANCIQNGMAFGFRRSLAGVAGILTQATLFLLLAAAGVGAVILSAPQVFFWLQIAGAALLIWLGLRGWQNAATPVTLPTRAGSIYGRAFLIATVNAKSLAGYIAAFSQFVQPDVPIWSQMWVIMPTALTLTALSYTSFTALGAALGHAALGAVFNTWLRRALAACFVIYGAALGSVAITGRTA